MCSTDVNLNAWYFLCTRATASPLLESETVPGGICGLLPTLRVTLSSGCGVVQYHRPGESGTGPACGPIRSASTAHRRLPPSESELQDRRRGEGHMVAVKKVMRLMNDGSLH